MKKAILIMAGGRGERFWPKSRDKLPKQFLSLTREDKTMIQTTVEHILPLVTMEDIYIVTNEKYEALIREQLPDLPEENVIYEPVGRNTAPCIGLGALHMEKKYGDAVMVVLPSDHLIRFPDIFVRTLEQASKTAQEGDNLVTIGIRPNYPETGYGYIRYNQSAETGQAFPVERFVEKPDLDTAKTYLADGNYLWNSGMFIWKTSSILQNLSNFLPNVYQGLMKIKPTIGNADYQSVLRDEFPRFESESIDYGVLEKAKRILVYPGDFGWDDVGSWLAVGRTKPMDSDGNVISGNVVTYGTRDCIIQGDKKLIATAGLKDVVVVDTSDALLICDKNHTADVKKIIQTLKEQNKGEYL